MSKSFVLKDRIDAPVFVGELQTVVDYNVTPEQTARRARMIEFLENECPVEAFVFPIVVVSHYARDYAEELLGRKLTDHCGTVGCAIGHARRIFNAPRFRSFDEDACYLFGLGYFDQDGWLETEEGRVAFSPYAVMDVPLPPAGDNATPQQVATRLRAAFARHPAP